MPVGNSGSDSGVRSRQSHVSGRPYEHPLRTLNVTVVNGVIVLWGTIGNDQECRAICVIAENTPGVKKVIDHLVFVEAYTGTVIEPPPVA